MDLIMLVPAILFLALSLYQFRSGLQIYADMFIGATRSDLLYGFGKPTSRTVEDGTETWTYASEGQTLRAGLVDGRLSRVTCEVTAPAGLCPEMFGVGSKATEDQVWIKLGAPTRQSFVGGIKYLSYDDIGVVLGLTRFSVFSVSLSHERSSVFGYLGRFVRLAVP